MSRSNPVASISSPVWYAALAVIVLGGVVLRLITLGHGNLWSDELFSRHIAMLPLHPALLAIQQDMVHPPLYYLLLKVSFSLWGTSDFGVRLLSLLAGSATVAFAGLLPQVLLDAPFAGLLAAALCALNSPLIFYSQETRSYALYTLFVLLLIFWAGRAARPGARSPLFWVSGFLLMTILVYTEYAGAIYIAVTVGALLTARLPAITKQLALLAATAAAVCLAPWLVVERTVYQARHGLTQHLGWIPDPVLRDLPLFWASALGASTVRHSFALGLFLVAVLLLAALLLGPSFQPLAERATLLVLLSCALLPPLLFFILSRPPLQAHLFLLRQILPSLASLIVLCAYGAERLASRWLQRFNTVFAATALLTCLAVAAPLLQQRFQPFRVPFAALAAALPPRQVEPVYAAVPTVAAPVDFYCGTPCVAPLPAQPPAHFIYLFEPNNAVETASYRYLLHHGFTLGRRAEYHGERPPSGTWAVSLVDLVRAKTSIGSKPVTH